MTMCGWLDVKIQWPTTAVYTIYNLGHPSLILVLLLLSLYYYCYWLMYEYIKLASFIFVVFFQFCVLIFIF